MKRPQLPWVAFFAVLVALSGVALLLWREQGFAAQLLMARKALAQTGLVALGCIVAAAGLALLGQLLRREAGRS